MSRLMVVSSPVGTLCVDRGFFIDRRGFCIAVPLSRDDGHAHFSPPGIAPGAIEAYLHGE